MTNDKEMRMDEDKVILEQTREVARELIVQARSLLAAIERGDITAIFTAIRGLAIAADDLNFVVASFCPRSNDGTGTIAPVLEPVLRAAWDDMDGEGDDE